MIHTDIVIIGGGPAGLCAAIEAGSCGAKVLLIERSDFLGGQLVKQTHKFFGSKKQYASFRGIDIADILLSDIANYKNVTIWKDSTVLGIYEDGVITVLSGNVYKKVRANVIVAATGASEKFMPFEGNDLPGVYGAGAVQTLMNLYGVVPAKNVVMMGAGNIGLIVSYQLLQAGVNVKAVFCTGPTIGGYLVHASKIRRMGVQILTSTLLERANGTDFLESVTLVKADRNRNKIAGTEFDIECDNLCISVGLSPLADLLWQAGCEMKYVGVLGGHVPVRNENYQTSKQNIFIAGDLAGVEEATAAMVEGRIVGITSGIQAGFGKSDAQEKLAEYRQQLESLRSGKHGVRIRDGIAAATR